MVQAKVHSPNLKVNDQCLGEGVQRAKKIKNSALKDLIVNENGRKYRTLIYFLIMMDLKKMYLCLGRKFIFEEFFVRPII